MNRVEELFYTVTKRHLPTATKVEYNEEKETLYVFFSTKYNEFEETETKSVRMLRIYTIMGGDRFDNFLSDIEDLHKILTLEGEPHNMDVIFLFV